MRAIPVKHPLFCAGAFAGLLTVCSAAVHPFGTPKHVDRPESFIDGLLPSPEVTAVLKQSCLDCHSNRTIWPWYSYVAPASWLIERDVHSGRTHMNVSNWQQYTFEQKQKLLADIATVVMNGEMPLRQYTFVHPKARLSEAGRNMLYTWARGERRKLKAGSRLASRP